MPSPPKAKLRGQPRAEKARGYDLRVVHESIEKIKKLRTGRNPSDIVERCATLGLPLVLTDDNKRERAFLAALAELAVLAEGDVSHGPHPQDLELVLRAIFGRNLLHQFHDEKGRYSILHKQSFRRFERDRIIGVVYPWYNFSLYADLIRIVRERDLSVAKHSNLAGNYRYFRFFPLNETRFTLMDGFFDIEIDNVHNMICFGQRSMNHHKRGYEHRGFVLPGSGKVEVITFRGGTMRLGTIWGDFADRTNGILLTSTRGNKRPFAARVLIVKKDSSDLFGLEIPKNKDNRSFVEKSKEYKYALNEFKKVCSGTVFPAFGFMWGNKLQHM
jgi:hypothetical protein